MAVDGVTIPPAAKALSSPNSSIAQTSSGNRERFYMRSSSGNPWVEDTKPRPVNTRSYVSSSNWIEEIENGKHSATSTYIDYAFGDEYNRIFKEAVRKERKLWHLQEKALTNRSVTPETGPQGSRSSSRRNPWFKSAYNHQFSTPVLLPVRSEHLVQSSGRHASRISSAPKLAAGHGVAEDRRSLALMRNPRVAVTS
eukprot:TRINITY_DN13293_c0_g1_i2.p1 TRINITY_DN13293_c0_g1~~TRINITY_DN13293_c0_g1_i2.p1  ORF type:complete len:229 (+),score=28.46 TRINITY_DN13293_c0_g1_i2:99-689(+)